MGKIPQPRPITLPRRLRMARDELQGVTAARMAELLVAAGAPLVSGSTITGWERGVSRPSIEVIELWAEITGVDLLWLTFGRMPETVAATVASATPEDTGGPPLTKWYDEAA